MRSIWKSLVLPVLLASAFVLPASAQSKIATIDLRKVFDDYFKTKAADTKLKDQAADLSKESKAYLEQFQKNQDEYRKLLEDANNQVVSTDEREKRKKAAESKLIELKELEQTIRQFETTSQATLREQRRQMREKILGEIRAVINTKAKTAGYTLVIDSVAESINETPIVLYNTGENDITAAVLTELNAMAPPAPAGSSSEKSTPSKRK